MFERFTQQARDVVVRAQTEARELRHDWMGTEHLFLGVLSQPQGPGVAALTRLGVTPDAFRGELVKIVGSSDRLGPADEDALRTLGIDLPEIRRRIEARFGPGALDPPRRPRRSWIPWGRRRCDVETAGHIRFTPRAKKAMECALRQAIARKDRHIGVEHVLLALLVDKENLALEVIRSLGIDPKTLRAEVLADLDQAA